MDPGGKARVDSWIWGVRLYKTRSAATAACRAGHVRINGERAKAAQAVRVGDEVRVRKSGVERIVVVTRLVTKRVAASAAAECLIDNSPPPPPRTEVPLPVLRDRGSGRPTKKQRREIDRLRARLGNDVPGPLG
ncbi:S4 domain-containing protein [Saxibacter everestensis]|uniref:S4 domain-containing protein n=1 Tax=Saxibacter everestensis TaxID=2909229 RepID=A0ABY8QXW4_9MICO|nr:S4 domain-containing protein [Brevibacteriaceae bacterium ZFBP1038]